jgi:glycosyltransferase involved in cell wall biosynthesis
MFRHGYNLAQELAKIGHHVVIAHIDQNESVTEEGGVKVYKFSGFLQHAAFLYAQSGIRHHGPMPDGMAIKKLAKIIDTEKPDLIHVHGWVLYSVASLRKSTGIPVVATLHDYGYFCPNKLLLRDNQKLCKSSSWITCLKCSSIYYGPVKGPMASIGVTRYGRLLKSNVDHFIAVSSYVQQRYIAAGFPEDKITIVPHFYRIEGKRSGSTIPEFLLPDHFILYVGTLSNAKGVNLLIEAYQKLQTSVKLILIGAREPGFTYQMNENIVVLENQPHDIVMHAWAKCLFGVIPSICAETFGMVALEAMACSKSIIASAIGGLKDIVIHEETGLLVKPGDQDALAAAMQKLLNNPMLSKTMGNNGHDRLTKEYLSVKIVDKLESIYGDVLKQSKND